MKYPILCTVLNKTEVGIEKDEIILCQQATALRLAIILSFEKELRHLRIHSSVTSGLHYTGDYTLILLTYPLSAPVIANRFVFSWFPCACLNAAAHTRHQSHL